MGFLHHNEMFDAMFEESHCDIKNLIVMQKTFGVLATKIGRVDRITVYLCRNR